MIIENKASLWLGYFEEEERFREYFKVSYDEDGKYIPSEFQKSFEIKKYDLYAVETDWLSQNCIDVMSLLQGFSGDEEIIPQFEKMIEASNVEKYNSIVLLYNFQYEADIISDGRMNFIGCVDVHI